MIEQMVILLGGVGVVVEIVFQMEYCFQVVIQVFGFFEIDMVVGNGVIVYVYVVVVLGIVIVQIMNVGVDDVVDGYGGLGKGCVVGGQVGCQQQYGIFFYRFFFRKYDVVLLMVLWISFVCFFLKYFFYCCDCI